MATRGVNGTGRNICRHCRKARDYRPRGLCWVCYYTPGVRDQYPAMTPQEAGAKGGRAYRPSQHRRDSRVEPV